MNKTIQIKLVMSLTTSPARLLDSLSHLVPRLVAAAALEHHLLRAAMLASQPERACGVRAKLPSGGHTGRYVGHKCHFLQRIYSAQIKGAQTAFESYPSLRL